MLQEEASYLLPSFVSKVMNTYNTILRINKNTQN